MARRVCPACRIHYEDLFYCQLCGQQLEGQDSGVTPQDSMIAKTINGRYRIFDILGYGGMALVYRGETIADNHPVAIKVIRREYSHNDIIVKRFVRECQLISQLHHRNTVSLLDVGKTEGGLPYLVMEFVDGELLDSAIKEGLDVDRILKIAHQICESMEEAHAIGIIHRDLKPDNVMLTTKRGDDTIKVFDFGVARMFDSQSGLTAIGKIVGTPAWMAPEQIRGEKIDDRTDIYSLGAMMYRMLSNRLLFEGTTIHDLLRKHLKEEPVPLSKLEPPVVVEEELENLIMTMLEKDPTQRPKSMTEVRKTIELIQKSRERRWSPTKWLLIVAGFTLLTLGVLLVILSR